jgi:hypothetical protein
MSGARAGARCGGGVDVLTFASELSSRTRSVWVALWDLVCRRSLAGAGLAVHFFVIAVVCEETITTIWRFLEKIFFPYIGLTEIRD